MINDFNAREVNNDAWCLLSRTQFLFPQHIFFPYTCSPIHQIHNLVCPFYKVRVNVYTSLQAFVTKHGLQSVTNIPIWSMLLTPVENSTQFINFLTLHPHLQILNFIQKYTCMNSNWEVRSFRSIETHWWSIWVIYWGIKHK